MPSPDIPSERVSSGERWEESPLTFPLPLPRRLAAPPTSSTDPYIPGRLLASWSLENCPHF